MANTGHCTNEPISILIDLAIDSNSDDVIALRINEFEFRNVMIDDLALYSIGPEFIDLSVAVRIHTDTMIEDVNPNAKIALIEFDIDAMIETHRFSDDLIIVIIKDDSIKIIVDSTNEDLAMIARPANSIDHLLLLQNCIQYGHYTMTERRSQQQK